MELKVVAFGIARDIINGKETTIDLPEGGTAAKAMDKLKSDYPAFNDLSSLQLAVNESYVDHDYEIQQGDELVLIPPVSGG